jgi:hypothetical protein
MLTGVARERLLIAGQVTVCVVGGIGLGALLAGFGIALFADAGNLALGGGGLSRGAVKVCYLIGGVVGLGVGVAAARGLVHNG